MVRGLLSRTGMNKTFAALCVASGLLSFLDAGHASAGRKSKRGTKPIAASTFEPLTPDDVFARASRGASSTARCHRRALIADPFFDVQSIDAVIVVRNDGQVAEVLLDEVGSAVFETCLTNAIQRWTFRPSADGIAVKLTLGFER